MRTTRPNATTRIDLTKFTPQQTRVLANAVHDRSLFSLLTVPHPGPPCPFRPTPLPLAPLTQGFISLVPHCSNPTRVRTSSFRENPGKTGAPYKTQNFKFQRGTRENWRTLCYCKVPGSLRVPGHTWPRTLLHALPFFSHPSFHTISLSLAFTIVL
jgi:hypothetical protein